ncbi:hypothetical protein Q765_00870 [Flavobacterium rivuli WB 3.3-2 = DSM 21788]|uniref:DUF4834 domain-containing protein n=1 Tax=Flavobacterium rivuli WB 3.3-2 = DSM 21788 TaxID=1121895 RepID=A0A0A2MJI4_9FLAO|nr:hypothetical protein [Flavobacterium rivuli]KGO88490.1 hypothetical protein Q765_00870 [Flavobacterium rivuli WB 3.3-2 = DSM 21788]
MDTASFPGIIRTLFIIMLVYYAVRYFLRLLAPTIVQQVVKKAGENLYQQQQQQQYNYQQDQESKTREERPKEKKKVGEYIDFEEID